MKYALLVAWREYAENAKTKGFWIGLLLFPVMILGMTNVPIFLEKKATPARHFVLVDQSGQFERVVEASLNQAHQQRVFNALRAYAAKHATPATNRGDLARSLETFLAQGGKDAFLARLQPHLPSDVPPFQEPRQLFRRVPLPADVPARGDLPALSQALKPYLRGAQKIEVEGQPVPLHAAILIPPDLERHIVRPDRPRGVGEAAPANIEYWSANLADTALRDEIERSIDAEIRRREYVARGLDMATAQAIEATHAPFASLNPRKEEGRETVNTADLIRQWAPSAFVYLLWVSIFSISQMLLSNTIEEKSNRIIEVLLSSVTPGELMTGKLLGIAGVGLTMVGAWVVAGGDSDVEERHRLGAIDAGVQRDPYLAAAAGVRILFRVRLFDVRGDHHGAGQPLQHAQGGAEFHGRHHPVHDGAADDDDVHPQGSQRHARHGAVVDSALHALRDDEPRDGGPAAVRPDRHDDPDGCLGRRRALVVGADFPDRHPAHRPAAEAARAAAVVEGVSRGTSVKRSLARDSVEL